MMERCRCRDCCAGDALPEHLQGWPGAWQMRLFTTGQRPSAVLNPPLDDWNFPGVRAACAERCGEVGDPPCYELGERAARGVNADTTDPIKPCGECWRDVGIEPGDEFDEAAAIARLL